MRSRARQGVAIWGAYGGMNVGDEAILAGLVQLLHSRGRGDLSLIVQRTPDPAQEARYRKMGLEPVSFRQPVRLLKSLAKRNLICGGGQLVDDRGRIGFPVGYTAALIFLNRVLGGMPVIFGIGAEPITRRLSRWLVKRGYALAGSAMTRDTRSYEALVASGFPSERAGVGGDLALTLELPVAGDKGSSSHALIVPNRDAQRVDDLSSTFTDVVRSARDGGYSVTVLAHDRRPEYDAGEVARLEDEFGSDGCVYVVPENLDQALAAYESADVVISARMHPLVLSMLHGVVPVAIPVVEKVRTLTADFGLPSIAPDNTTADQILSAMRSAEGRPFEDIESILTDRRDAVERSFDAVMAAWDQADLIAQET